MTVRELIAELQKHDQDLVVQTPQWNQEWGDAGIVTEEDGFARII